MVDCRPAAGAPPHELPHAAPNGAPPTTQQDNHHQQAVNQAGGSGDMGSHGMTSPASVRASTPATNNVMNNYTGVTGVGGGMGPVYGVGWVKAGMWPPQPPQPQPPLHVNPHVYKSVQANGADLPMNDIPTLRYYYNLGVECMWAAYGPPPPPPPPPHPPRHYSPRDIAQDMQAMSLHERTNHAHAADMNHKHKPQPDKQINNQNKNNGQRTLLGPRFNKRGNNQDGNQNSNHNQNKGHNNNMNNKGPNNRRNMALERGAGGGGLTYGAGAEGEPVEAPLLTVPYIPYPPPVYPLQYYPVDPDPAMMGMIPGVGYVGYEEGTEFVPYYPHPLYGAPPPPPHAAHPHPQHPQHLHPHPHHHVEHK